MKNFQYIIEYGKEPLIYGKQQRIDASKDLGGKIPKSMKSIYVVSVSAKSNEGYNEIIVTRKYINSPSKMLALTLKYKKKFKNSTIQHI